MMVVLIALRRLRKLVLRDHLLHPARMLCFWLQLSLFLHRRRVD
jgi:hypothetical protein